MQLWYTITKRRSIYLDWKSLEINILLKVVFSVMSSLFNISVQ